jgi:hypothetical protein
MLIILGGATIISLMVEKQYSTTLNKALVTEESTDRNRRSDKTRPTREKKILHPD